jgi:hypothetical protein
MKIGIIGSGMVARSLGTGFLSHGYEVMLGTRDKSKLDEWQTENPKGNVGSFSEAASFGDLVVLAVKGIHSLSAIEKAGVANLNNKTVIDAGNPIDDSKAPEDGVLQFYTDQNGSLMEQLQDSFPQVNFVKAFNSVGSHLMVNPDFGGIKPTMFIAGNNQNSKQEVTAILEKFGWESEDMGTAKAARAIEPLCMLWCIPGFNQNNWSHAFKLLR